jgi:hypothetical protein
MLPTERVTSFSRRTLLHGIIIIISNSSNSNVISLQDVPFKTQV